MIITYPSEGVPLGIPTGDHKVAYGSAPEGNALDPSS